MSKRIFYHCTICNNLFGVINDSGVNPVCCNQNMEVLTPNTKDASQEKHVPALKRNGKDLNVKVGSDAHPMLAEHYIQWIVAAQGDYTQRIALHPDNAPEGNFVLPDADAPVTVYEYCNLHGLWSSEG